MSIIVMLLIGAKSLRHSKHVCEHQSLFHQEGVWRSGHETRGGLGPRLRDCHVHVRFSISCVGCMESVETGSKVRPDYQYRLRKVLP